jgi:hypothetical protein
MSTDATALKRSTSLATYLEQNNANIAARTQDYGRGIPLESATAIDIDQQRANFEEHTLCPSPILRIK